MLKYVKVVVNLSVKNVYLQQQHSWCCLQKIHHENITNLSSKIFLLPQYLQDKKIPTRGHKKLKKDKIQTAFGFSWKGDNLVMIETGRQAQYRWEKARQMIMVGITGIFNVSREAATFMSTSSACKKILHYYISIKICKDRTSTFKPIENDIMKLDGQVLPKRLYCGYNSLFTEPYIAHRTIQFHKCCKFGYMESYVPQCSKCGQSFVKIN